MVGPLVMSPGATCNAELPQRLDQGLLNFLQLGRIGRDATFAVVFLEQIDARAARNFRHPILAPSLGRASAADFVPPR